jgi:hypothetical protein
MTEAMVAAYGTNAPGQERRVAIYQAFVDHFVEVEAALAKLSEVKAAPIKDEPVLSAVPSPVKRSRRRIITSDHESDSDDSIIWVG